MVRDPATALVIYHQHRRDKEKNAGRQTNQIIWREAHHGHCATVHPTIAGVGDKNQLEKAEIGNKTKHHHQSHASHENEWLRVSSPIYKLLSFLSLPRGGPHP